MPEDKYFSTLDIWVRSNGSWVIVGTSIPLDQRGVLHHVPCFWSVDDITKYAKQAV